MNYRMVYAAVGLAALFATGVTAQERPNVLYDMTDDPGETTNLVDDPAYAEVVADLDARLVAFFSEYAEPTFDLWNGGTGKALVYYGRRNRKFRDAFPDWREPFVEKQTAFRDR